LFTSLRREITQQTSGQIGITMTQIFTLRGKSNVGKTETLRLLLDALIMGYPNAIPTWIHGPAGRNSCVVLSNVGKFTVGIEGYGDRPERISASFRQFRKWRCDLIFCAARTKGDTLNFIVQNKGDLIHLIPKVAVQSQKMQKAANVAMMKKLRALAGI